MINLLTDSDDWSQPRSVVAHLQYSVVTSGEDTGRRRVQVVRGNQSNWEDGYTNSSGYNSFYSLTRRRTQRKEQKERGALRSSPPAIERGQRGSHIGSDQWADTDTRSKSVRSFHSKWITGTKYAFARSRRQWPFPGVRK